MSKTWAFTDFDVSDARQQFWKDLESTYMCFGVEEATTTSRKHLQGWITFKRTYRLKQLQKIVGTCHIEKGKCADGMNYCMKEGNYVIQDRRKQGHRSDLEAITKALADGTTMEEAVGDRLPTYARYHRGLQAVQQLKRKPIEMVRHVTWVWGPPGAGKTKWAWEQTQGECFIAQPDLVWFDGYEYEDTVIIDDIDFKAVRFPKLLRLLDRLPLRVPVKGGFVAWLPSTIFITCTLPPDEAFAHEDTDIRQLLRRIDVVREVVADVDD